MMARYHFIISSILVIAFGMYWTPALIIPFMIGGVLVDFDHQLDFFLIKKRFTLSVTELSKELEGTRHFLLPLHSYEAILAPIILAFIFPTYSAIIMSFGIGLTIHMILDITFNGYPNAQCFSLTYRLLTGWWRR